jgi:hypothetical protein
LNNNNYNNGIKIPLTKVKIIIDKWWNTFTMNAISILMTGRTIVSVKYDCKKIYLLFLATFFILSSILILYSAAGRQL